MEKLVPLTDQITQELAIHTPRAKQPYAPLPRNVKPIVKQVRDAKQKMIQSLSLVETSDGWPDPVGESFQLIWTSIEVLKSLAESGVFPKNYDAVLCQIDNAAKQENDLYGWEYEGLEGHISVYLTGDVIRLYLALRRFDSIDALVNSLQRIQNDDGGWGVCDGDKTSKVRSTSWVLGILLACLNCSPTQQLIDLRAIEKGLKWLYTAQNDRDEDYGWGNMPDSLPSNVTATSLALDALLEAIRYCQSHSSNPLPIRTDSVRRGIQRLIQMGANGYWRGPKEEFGIRVDDKPIGRHVIGGSGTTYVLQVLIKACEVGFIEPQHHVILDGIHDLINRCKRYRDSEGTWLVPADDGGAPLVWNSAYALDAFNAFERMYLTRIASSWIEKSLHEAITRWARVWRQGFFVLLAVISAFVLLPQFQAVSSLTSWFAGLSTLQQGLVMVIIGILVEQLITRVWRRFIAPLWQTIGDKLDGS